MATIAEKLAVAVAHHQAGRFTAAEPIYRQILKIKPDHPDAIHLLGLLAHQTGKPQVAVEYIGRAIRLQGTVGSFHYNLGNALMDLGKLDKAVDCYRRALELEPNFAAAHANLGTALQGLGMLDDAVVSYRRALELQPGYAQVHYNLGNALQGQGRLDEAIASFHRALSLQPQLAQAHNNLGNAFKAQGKLDEAIAAYRRACEVQPDFAAAYSNLLYVLNLSPDYDAQTIYAEHRRWNQRFGEPLAKLIQPHANKRSTNRRLRIGYVSPYFCEGTTGVFLLPLLEAHDHEHFEIFCYSSVRVPDTTTERFRAQADVWRNVAGSSDEQLAQTIRHDRIDILVDLTMHTADNRLLVFARKPAPVQVAYLAYAGTTGLGSMDYRLTDPYLDPPTQDERIYSEESIRLPETFWCYRPLIETPAVNALPALQTGQITFGSLNNFAKVTAPTLAAWISLMQAMPEARLLLHANCGEHRDRVRELFARQRVSPERLTFTDSVPWAEYFQLYHHIDVALDPFPYAGGTTTCDALWMGVPVVSLAGQTAVGRGGLSILSNVGLADLVAQDAEQYVRIARELACDLPRLSHLRATLRERMQASPLMDAPRFARNVEAAYREMWRRWCAK
jgi:protein O-GlcNAc transferase